MSDAAIFASAREFLLRHRLDYEKAYADFRWPQLTSFNWARDWFDVYAKEQTKIALWIVEAAVVPARDAVRLFVPKAFVTLVPEIMPDIATARRILFETNARLASYKRIRRIEFALLPKTISGKIRRVELRNLERERHAAGAKGRHEFYGEEC